MNANDQYFVPGDKVMKVCNASRPDSEYWCHNPSGSPQFGVVYCVQAAWQGRVCNVIELVGFAKLTNSSGHPVGFEAADYRKVEEIKLCVAAAERAKEPDTVKV